MDKVGRFRLPRKLALAALILFAAFPAFSQVVPAAIKAGIPLVIGGGFSGFYSDWDGYFGGPAAWIDWNFDHGPALIRGLGIELEGRDLNYFRTGTSPNLRQDTATAGLIYTKHLSQNLHAYAKCGGGIGSTDFPGSWHYNHDTRTVIAPGGGVELRASGHVWIRADYEYQFWPNFIRHHTMTPSGATVGVSYNFKRGR